MIDCAEQKEPDMRTSSPPRTQLSRLRQVTLSATVSAALALLLSACGGGGVGDNSGTDLGKAAGSSTAAAALSPSETTQVQAEGAALNTEELNDALAEAKSLSADTALVAGQVAPLAAYQSGQVAQKAAAVQLPVYRFFNTRTRTHFYTSNVSERDSVKANLAFMNYEGLAFFAASEPSPGLKPVFRLLNTRFGTHFYTISERERETIQEQLPDTQLEGVAYYASPVAGTGFKPLYRFFSPRAGSYFGYHFYSASDTERQHLRDTASSTYIYEGVGYYVLTGDCALVNSTTQQATPNACFLANNAAEVSVTLPLSADLAVGDTLKVSGLGAGGWRISQNANQRVQTTLPGALPFVWTARESIRTWDSVASSADGNKLVAVSGTASGQIYTSSNAGADWTASSGPTGNWTSVASSADGNQLVAVSGTASGQIYTSSDAGANWTASSGPTGAWRSVASSADGNKLIAAAYNGQIYTSSDAGLTWTDRGLGAQWYSVASSADGNKLVALVWGGEIFTSSNAGVTWADRGNTHNWSSVASSADGNKLVAVDIGYGASSPGQIHTSSDAGANWTASGPTGFWSSVASSADGNRLVAAGYNGQIYTSSDSGANWTARENNRSWYSVASSADGNKLVAVANGDQIYTAQTSTAPGVSGFLHGEAGSVIELRYLGNGVFELVNASGTVGVGQLPP
ncbi:hypothetical protein LPB72_05515 [Hydrogenophaga crassostreae]|uniref:DUF5648 domain-containing protein n=2 Tax=Hydrogenophaga crassostreae TaxID=1763535 RepID=A0ABX2U9U8_9BURK|nr:hypothetical protein LPB72_05515 [Hydrogenophaga crassostreae]